MKNKNFSYLLNKSKKKSYEEGFEDGVGENIWMMTFSDLFSLLLVFFIILLVISVPDQAKMKETMQMIQKALKYKMVIKKEKVLLDELMDFVGEANLSTVATVEQTTRGVKLIIAGDFSFKPGEAALKPDQKKLLDGIGPILGDMPNKIEITAHTDITPINTAMFPSNWALSASRASAVTNYLVEKWDVQGARLLAIGSGEFRPRYSPPNTVENMKKNRRLEIEIVNTGLGQRREEVSIAE